MVIVLALLTVHYDLNVISFLRGPLPDEALHSVLRVIQNYSV